MLRDVSHVRKNRRFSTNISLCIGNSTRQGQCATVRSVTHDFLRYISILTYLLTWQRTSHIIRLYIRRTEQLPARPMTARNIYRSGSSIFPLPLRCLFATSEFLLEL